jgi:hypothetical protein
MGGMRQKDKRRREITTCTTQRMREQVMIYRSLTPATCR